MENVIEVNGSKYVQKQDRQSSRRMPPELATIMMGAMAMGGGFDFGERRSASRPKIDIVKEYGLIQQKKSNLSRSQRDAVVAQFEYNYTKISLPRQTDSIEKE